MKVGCSTMNLETKFFMKPQEPCSIVVLLSRTVFSKEAIYTSNQSLNVLNCVSEHPDQFQVQESVSVGAGTN